MPQQAELGHNATKIIRGPIDGSWAEAPARKGLLGMEDWLQYALLLSGWVAAFMLGKELQTGFAQWRARRRNQ